MVDDSSVNHGSPLINLCLKWIPFRCKNKNFCYDLNSGRCRFSFVLSWFGWVVCLHFGSVMRTKGLWFKVLINADVTKGSPNRKREDVFSTIWSVYRGKVKRPGQVYWWQMTWFCPFNLVFRVWKVIRAEKDTLSICYDVVTWSRIFISKRPPASNLVAFLFVINMFEVKDAPIGLRLDGVKIYFFSWV